jgi:hypothetical protein
MWPFPPDDWLMAVFSGYFDDSRTRPGVNRVNITAVAGYVATMGGWGNFEAAWAAFLGRHGITYLHMEELFGFRGQFERFDPGKKKNTDALIAMMSDAVSVIRDKTKDYDLRDFSSVVYVDHFARVQRRFGVALDDYALGVAGCRVKIAEEYRGHEVEAMFDNFKGCTKGLRRSEVYLESYPGGEDCMEQVTARRAPFVAKRLPGLQAADFAGYEIRRYFSHQYRADRRHGQMQPRKSFKYLYDLMPSEVIHRSVRLDYPQIIELAKKCDLSKLPRSSL